MRLKPLSHLSKTTLLSLTNADAMRNDFSRVFYRQNGFIPLMSNRVREGLFTDGILSEQAEGFKILDAFIKWAQTNHITVLATFPSTVYQPDYDGVKGQQTIQTITHLYQTHNVPVIATAREAMLPLDDFYDTKYHLTHEAAIKRTDRLIPELRPYLHLPK